MKNLEKITQYDMQTLMVEWAEKTHNDELLEYGQNDKYAKRGSFQTYDEQHRVTLMYELLKVMLDMNVKELYYSHTPNRIGIHALTETIWWEIINIDNSIKELKCVDAHYHKVMNSDFARDAWGYTCNLHYYLKDTALYPELKQAIESYFDEKEVTYKPRDIEKLNSLYVNGQFYRHFIYNFEIAEPLSAWAKHIELVGVANQHGINKVFYDCRVITIDISQFKMFENEALNTSSFELTNRLQNVIVSDINILTPKCVQYLNDHGVSIKITKQKEKL